MSRKSEVGRRKLQRRCTVIRRFHVSRRRFFTLPSSYREARCQPKDHSEAPTDPPWSVSVWSGAEFDFRLPTSVFRLSPLTFGRSEVDTGPVITSVDQPDRKSTRLNSSHVKISYAV